MLQKRTRDEMLKFSGSDIPAKLIFMDGENNLVTDTCELTDTAVQGDSWLNTICQKWMNSWKLPRRNIQTDFR